MSRSAGDVKLRGVFTPILTPLTPEEEVDEASLRKLTNYLIKNGIHGIWAAGTTGEFAALDETARRLVIETVVDEAAGRVPVIGNVSAPATRATAAIAKELRDCPVTGLAATPPYYYSNTQAELLDHFRAISDQCSQPLWLYNIPSTVKVTIEPETIAELATDGTVIGVKDSSGGAETFAQLVMLCRQRKISLVRLVGTIWRTTMAGCGVHGIVPGIANLVPLIVTSAWESGQREDQEVAGHYLDQAAAASRVIQLGSVFSTLKSALKMMGIIQYDTVSSPFKPAEDEVKILIRTLLNDLNLL